MKPAFIEKIIRPCGRLSDCYPVAAFLAFLVVLLGELVGEIIIGNPAVSKLLEWVCRDADTAVFLGLYFSFIGIWISTFVMIWIFKAEKPIRKIVTKEKKGNTIPWALIGLLLGFGMNGFCILMASIMGDIRLSFAEFNPVLLLLFLICVCIQSGAEEFVTRGYLYEKLRRRYRHPAVAIVGNSLLFGILHIFNPNASATAILQTVLVGILLSLMVYYYESFWCAVMIHTGWNFTQSILFGLPNSGKVSAYSLFSLDAASARDGFFYNVGFGVEGSIGASIVIIAVCAAVFYFGSRQGIREDMWKEEERKAEALKAGKTAQEQA